MTELVQEQPGIRTAGATGISIPEPCVESNARNPLLLILFFGLALRALFLLTPRSYHADEIFQYLEQAHRLAFGYGVVPWEYHYGIRSWLLPMLLSGPMAAGEWLWPGSSAYLILPRVCLCVFSLGSVVAAYALGRRLSPAHATAAALAAAFWPEFALFAGQALTDSIAVPLALAAAALLRPSCPRWKLFLVGALLALAGVIRFQYLPAFSVLLVISLRNRWREWCWVAGGAATALLLAAIPDLVMKRRPYGWFLENLHMNIGAGQSRVYGVEGPFFYLYQLGATWAIWILPLLWLAWLGGRRYPALLAMAATNIAVHSAIAHKEYRFILLSTMTIVILAAIGTVEAVKRYRALRYRRWVIAGWLLAALTSLGLPAQMEAWDRAVPGNQAFAAIRRDPGTCGVAMWEEWWTAAGGYTYLHRPVPLYLPGRTSDPSKALWEHQSAFNVVLAPSQPKSPLPPAYRLTECFGPRLYNDQTACVWERAGGCRNSGAEDMEINNIVGEPDKPRTLHTP